VTVEAAELRARVEGYVGPLDRFANVRAFLRAVARSGNHSLFEAVSATGALAVMRSRRV
jgi:hypothetical protein